MICQHCGCVFCWDEADEGGGPKLYCSKVCARKAVKHRQRHRQLERSLQACAERGKVSFESKGAAMRGAENPSRRVGCRLYPYECACGKWHLTSRAPLTPEREEMASALKARLFGGEPIVRDKATR